MAATPLGVSMECWSRIGIGGDRSCPELEALIHCRNCPVFASAARQFFDRPAPAGYLENWSALLATGPGGTAEEGESIGTLVFRLGTEWLAFLTRVVAEVAPVRPVHRIPHRSNAVVSGLVNVRGQLQLAASLHGLLGVEPPPAPSRGVEPRILVLRDGNDPWVIFADEVAGVRRVPRAELRAVPSTLANPNVSFSQSVFSWEGRSVGLLDEGRVFSALRSLGR